MLVITKRPELERVIFSAVGDCCQNLVFADTFPDAAALTATEPVVVDLASFAEGHILDVAINWRRLHPRNNYVYAAPLQHPQEEMQLLAVLLPLGPARLLTRSDINSRTTWLELAQHRPLELWKHLRTLLERSLPGPVVEAGYVWPILRHAPDVQTIQEYCKHQHLSSVTVWRHLTCAGQRQPKELLAAFRVLWCVQFMQDGLSGGHLAHSLHVTKDQLLRLARPLGGTYRCMTRLVVNDVVDVYAGELLRSTIRGQKHPEALPPLRNIGKLLRLTSESCV